VRVSRLRRFVLERLAAAKTQNESDTFELSDAQLLIARSYGFESWQQLGTQAERDR